MKSLVIGSLVLLARLVAGPNLPPALRLIPTPQVEQNVAGNFQFEPGMALTADAGADEFAVRQLVDEVRTDLDVRLRTAPKGNGARIVIGRLDGDSAVDSAAFAAGLSLPQQASDEGYVLSVTQDSIVIGARSAAGVLYGVQTLRQLVRANADGRSIPCCRIVDWPALKYRGWQNDISRGPIPKMDTLKREIRTLSEFKLNAFTLYTEHVFKLKKHPTIAPSDGITAEQVRELQDYAKPYHVEIFGNFQSFGHFYNILKVPGYGEMGETDSVVSPSKEKTYKFLSDVYSEIAPAYDSPMFVINCDETYGLGEGAAKDMVAKMGIDGVYAYHISRIASLLKPYGKTPLMWGDIALRNPGIISKLPKDVVALSWGYDPRPNFDDAIVPFVKLGLRFMVCPGVNCWSQMWPDMDAAQVNISNYIRDGARHGALGALNTCWDDDGENLLNYCWYPLVWGGECSWNPAVPNNGQDENVVRDARRRQFDASFDGDFYGLPGSAVASAILSLSRLRNVPGSGGLNDGAFWRDPIAVGEVSAADGDKLFSGASQAMATFQSARLRAPYNADTLDYAAFAARRIRFMGEEIASGPAKSAAMDGEARSIKAEYVGLWNQEDRPWWLSQNERLYDRFTATLQEVPYRVAIAPGKSDFQGTLNVSMTAMSPGSHIRYTLDGSDPVSTSPVYGGALAIAKSTVIRAAGFWPDGKRGPTAMVEYHSWKMPARIETSMPTHEDYAPMRAFDGSDQSYFWSDGQPHVGDTFTLILDNPGTFSSVLVHTGTPDHPDDIAHDAVLEYSNDGTTFEKLADFANGIAQADLAGKTVKAVRIRILKQAPNWLTIREIDLR